MSVYTYMYTDNESPVRLVADERDLGEVARAPNCSVFVYIPAIRGDVEFTNAAVVGYNRKRK